MTHAIDIEYTGVRHRHADSFRPGEPWHPAEHYGPVAQSVLFLLTLESAIRDKRASEMLGEQLLRRSIDATLGTLLRLEETHWLRKRPEICTVLHGYVGLGPRDGNGTGAGAINGRMEWLGRTYDMPPEELELLRDALLLCDGAQNEADLVGVAGVRKFFTLQLEHNRTRLPVTIPS